MDRARICVPATRVPILIFTRSHPRNLLSIARSNSARSRMRPSRSRKKRIAQIWRTFNARLAPTWRPAFQAGRPLAAGSYCEMPIVVLLRPGWPTAKRWDKVFSAGDRKRTDSFQVRLHGSRQSNGEAEDATGGRFE